MESENKINSDILNTTMAIHASFPELSRFIEEMPVTIPDVAIPVINAENLKEYNDSLQHILTSYTVTHIH